MEPAEAKASRPHDDNSRPDRSFQGLLATDIAAVQRHGVSDSTIAVLHKRFRDLRSSAAEHARLLNTSLDDTKATLQLVNAQLASLLANASLGLSHVR